MAAITRRVFPLVGSLLRDKTTLLSTTPLHMISLRSVTVKDLPVHYRYRDVLRYGVYAAQPGLVKASALESARLAIIRKTKNKQIIMIKAHVPMTKKALGSRMGKGKGKVDHYVANVKAGKILFEYSSDSEALALEAFRQASNRLPVKTHFRERPRIEKQVWTF